MTNELIVFDIDGTLTNSVEMYHNVVIEAMKSLGITDIDTNFNDYKHHTDRYALRFNYERNFKKAMPVETTEDFEKALESEINKRTPISEINGAKTLIEALKVIKKPFCFATGSLPIPAMQKLDQCSIWYHEDLIATSKGHDDREGFVKEAIAKSSAFYNIEKFDKIISVGDGVWDLKTARNLGLDFIGIGKKNKEKLLSLEAEKWYQDIDALHKELI